ncbi:hypothetical protein J6590_004824 [Homalodisca vitripennis]|nr:hypothetical protein J6590_004824 [Homalodisca vitripennis]
MAGQLATGISLRAGKLGAGVNQPESVVRMRKPGFEKYESLSISRHRKTHVISAFIYYARKSCALNLFPAAL